MVGLPRCRRAQKRSTCVVPLASEAVAIVRPADVRGPLVWRPGRRLNAAMATSRSSLFPLVAIAALTACTAHRDYLRDAPARPTPATVTAVVEIPAGTTDKWEVKLDGSMQLDRVVRYLGYPANYGIVPRAILGEEIGGDGDPLDVLVLGPAIARGSTVEVREIGTIRLVDAGEQDDKLIAVPMTGALAGLRSVAQLDAEFPGVTVILRTFFENYKGKGRLQCQGFGGPAEASGLIDRCVASYRANK